MADNVLRQIKKIVYQLKRQYGLLMYIGYEQTADVVNLETGKMTRDLVYIKVRRGVMLPQRMVSSFAYDLSYIAANKNFTYGGFFQVGTRVVLIDAKDLPTDFEITGDMYVVFDDRRYEIKEHAKAEHGFSWLLKVKQVTSTDDVVISSGDVVYP